MSQTIRLPSLCSLLRSRRSYDIAPMLHQLICGVAYRPAELVTRESALKALEKYAEDKPTDVCVEELYLATLCRGPNTQELAEARGFITSSPSPAEGYQDLLWALMNSKQFLFIR